GRPGLPRGRRRAALARRDVRTAADQDVHPKSRHVEKRAAVGGPWLANLRVAWADHNALAPGLRGPNPLYVVTATCSARRGYRNLRGSSDARAVLTEADCTRRAARGRIRSRQQFARTLHVATTNLLRSNPRLRLMRVCLTVLAVLAAAAIIAVAALYVSSAYYA